MILAVAGYIAVQLEIASVLLELWPEGADVTGRAGLAGLLRK